MTPIEMIKQTGQLPNKFTIENGQTFELFVRKRTGNKGYLATYWEIIDGAQDNILVYGEGKTVDESKQDLKIKLLRL